MKVLIKNPCIFDVVAEFASHIEKSQKFMIPIVNATVCNVNNDNFRIQIEMTNTDDGSKVLETLSKEFEEFNTSSYS